MTRTALVTGGNRGLGLEVVKKMALMGHKVLLGCRDLEQGNDLAIRTYGRISAVELDLSNSKILRAKTAAIIDAHGPIDILINNAGILTRGDATDTKSEDFYNSIQVNLTACFDLIQMLLPSMIKRDYGRIVNVTSDWGSFADGLAGPVSYSVSKAALNALTLSMSHTLPKNVKINSVHPGWLQTDMGGQGAPLTAEEGAKTVVWLANAPAIASSGGFYHRKMIKAW